MNASAQVKFAVPAEVRKDGAYFVAGCPPFDIFSQGEAEESALLNLAGESRCFTESCYERGTLLAALAAP